MPNWSPDGFLNKCKFQVNKIKPPATGFWVVCWQIPKQGHTCRHGFSTLKRLKFVFFPLHFFKKNPKKQGKVRGYLSWSDIVSLIGICNQIDRVLSKIHQTNQTSCPTQMYFRCCREEVSDSMSETSVERTSYLRQSSDW